MGITHFRSKQVTRNRSSQTPWGQSDTNQPIANLSYLFALKKVLFTAEL